MPAADERALGERLAAVEQRVEDLRSDIRVMQRTIEGPPREESIRGRLHKLESSDVAAQAASAALETARSIRDRALSRSEKIIVACFTGVITICTVVTTVSVLMQHTH